MWQALRNELHPKGLELVTVGLDTLGAEGCRPFIEAARPEHPSLVDTHHVLAELFGVINIPQSVWIDEQGMIVRPAETAPAPPGAPRPRPADSGQAMPQRFREIMAEAAKIRQDAEAYHAALREWVEKGADSRYALPPEEVIARSRPRSVEVALGHAHFELASELERRGHHEAAVRHFRAAHSLVLESWTFRRQAWSLEGGVGGPLARFWQGPPPDDPQSWPYEGDWLSDIREAGAENYYERWRPASAAPTASDLGLIARQCGTNGRRLRRQFAKYLGLGPKQMDRVIRVQRCMRAIAQAPQRPLVSLALSAGFSDQAHFSREFKSLVGCTPRTYASRIGRMHDKTLETWTGMNPNLRHAIPPPVVRFT